MGEGEGVGRGSEYLRLTTHKSHKINQGSERSAADTHTTPLQQGVSLVLSFSLALASPVAVSFSSASYGMFGAISDGR